METERFGLGVNDILLHQAELEYVEIRRRLDSLLDDALRSATDENQRLEFRRRAQELHLALATAKQRSVDECEIEIQKLYLLGFSTPKQKLQEVGSFSRYCLEQGRKDVGYKYLLDALHTMDWTLGTAKWSGNNRTPDHAASAGAGGSGAEDEWA